MFPVILLPKHTATMNKKYLPIIFLLAIAQANAQVPEEALRISWKSQTGTARNQAIGGAMGSLGGDATANLVNPAGLAFLRLLIL